MQKASNNFDIIIGGGGIAGLTLAVALKSALGRGIKVLVCDPGLEKPDANMWRATAIAAGPRQMLETLGVWQGLADAQPITRMVCTDSRVADPVRPVFLRFEPPKQGQFFAHMVFNAQLREALKLRALELDVELRAQSVPDFTTGIDAVQVKLNDETELTTRLLIAADGVGSKLRDKARIAINRIDYDQAGIVATIAHERPHEGVAEEHFLPDGPFAILPLTKNRSSIVWSDKKSNVVNLLALDAEDFLAELTRRFSLRFGDFKVLDRPQSFPLRMQYARHYVAQRFALLGDAAHVIHPIAGQGLNLGLKDVAVLAEIIIAQMRLGLDPGAAASLRAYERARRFDALSIGAAADMMYRLFSNDILPVRLIRDLGLGLVDRAPPLKHLLVREASGLLGAVPALLRGDRL